MKLKAFLILTTLFILLSGSSLTPIFHHSILASSSIQIHDIQGTHHQSNQKDQYVHNVRGIVTYQYHHRGQQYMHIQTADKDVDNNPNTSEALVVYTGKDKSDAKVGDAVEVSGIIREYAIEGYADRHDTDLPITELDARKSQNGNIAIKASNQKLPKPIKIRRIPTQIASQQHFDIFDRNQYAIDFWESLEGMRVQVDDVRSVGPEQHGDIFTVLKNTKPETHNGGLMLKPSQQNGQRIPFKLVDNNHKAETFDVKTGDSFKGPLTGVVGYGYQNYKVLIDTQDMKKAYQDSHHFPKGTTIEPSQNKLTVASYNLENFSNNTSSTSDDKAQKIAKGIVTHMKKPDIIGVTEVQDNNGPDEGNADADQSYQRLIRSVIAAGGPTYRYVNIDPEPNEDGGQPNANIRVGFLYNPNRVTFNDTIQHGDATTTVHYKNGQLSHNPGRIEPNAQAFQHSRKPLAAQFDFNGEQIIAIVNHWNSKGGDDPLFGQKQPVEYQSETQRKSIAQLVGQFVNEIHEDNTNAHVVSVGDYNDFQWSDAVKHLESHNLYNMVNAVEGSSRYSYVYQGNSQTLDHILVSQKLKPFTQLDMIHVNSDFTDLSGRASDHDPLLAQIDFEQYKAAHSSSSTHTSNTISVIDQKKSDGQLLIQNLKQLPQSEKNKYKAEVSSADTFTDIQKAIDTAQKHNDQLPTTGERFAIFGIILGLPLIIIGLVIIFKRPQKGAKS
ncbi:endonuclease/exonuclease/phosphatase family protein [Staphylococcus felis]|uniref:endonuclease/exonuclease/phosphatase family protein n=1 Tax=Staphylococcus felis TaxID=46127 RepID=UPI0039679DEC